MAANDLAIYERNGEAWWDDRDRTFASLRSVSRFRLNLLRRWMGPDATSGRIVDLGCGGGLLSVPLAGSGARVIGIDRSHKSLCAASEAASKQSSDRCRFVQSDLRQVPLSDGCADVVLLADVIEHIDTPAAAIQQAARLLVPGGVLFVSTLNRTLRAHLLAVTVAERIGLIPRGTHDPRLFHRPEVLDEMAHTHGLLHVTTQGESIALCQTVRKRSITLKAGRSRAISYCTLYRKAAGR